MELGVAGSIAVKQISEAFVDSQINAWLEANPDTEIINIKFAANASEGNFITEALIIYRKED
ncbi:hypothetical protein ACTHP3_21040 [Shouchella rhizosphaerae]|uniref:hypothetical protein n=1 Tax=Shouchella rhizosphaerae TaxID=866786 RepID=UPI003F7CEE91